MKIFAGFLLTVILAFAGFAQTALRFEFEDVCGSPVVESQHVVRHTGIVTKIIDGETVEIKDEYGKVWTVELAGVGAAENNEEVKVYLARTILNKKVSFNGNPDKAKDPLIEAMITRKKIDVNRHLIENGLAKYRETEYGYAVSNYRLCVLDKLEEKARLAKLGIWAKQ